MFSLKYIHKVFYGEKRYEIGKILRELCGWKGIMIIESEVCQAHEHMPEEIPPKMSVSSFVSFLKGKSSFMVYERWSNIKFKYRNREFLSKGHYVDSAGKNAHKIAEYIQHQLKNTLCQTS